MTCRAHGSDHEFTTTIGKDWLIQSARWQRVGPVVGLPNCRGGGKTKRGHGGHRGKKKKKKERWVFEHNLVEKNKGSRLGREDPLPVFEVKGQSGRDWGRRFGDRRKGIRRWKTSRGR